MNPISLCSEDLSELAILVKDLNFEDPERRSALLECGSRDFNAVPGSGKTSLLAAKLLLLAKKWPHARHGICVLSHTNVARDEITKRLAKTTEGAKLLSYPHFIGTIHSFINQFFAMPILRSLGQKVDVIDDDIFAERALIQLQQAQFYKLRYYLNNQRNGDEIPTTLFYRTEKLVVQVEKGRLPNENTSSYASLIKLKGQLTEQGVFRHRDMFAFADLALKRYPNLVDVVHRRFPMIFIDEMQDTSWEQESFLNRVFDRKSVMQRFGDVDQKILSDDENSNLLTFPRDGYGSINTSKRFGKAIAEAVGSVRVSSGTVVGEAAETKPPVLLLYGTADANKVVSCFGRMAIVNLTEKAVNDGKVKAMCARKSGVSDVKAGRHLLDYWPSYGKTSNSEGKRSESFWSLVVDPKGTLQDASLNSRVSDVRRALLLVLRAAKASCALGVHDARALPRAANAVAPIGQIEKITRQLVLFGEEFCSFDLQNTLVQMLYTELKPFLPEDLDLDTFLKLSIFEDKGELLASYTADPTKCEVLHQGRRLNIGLGTVASMKGETHAASLVLESFGGSSRRFDVELGLQYIAGTAPKKIEKLPKTQQAQMRNLYVAMSRPTELLCLAANENRVPQGLINILLSKGWEVKTVT